MNKNIYKLKHIIGILFFITLNTLELSSCQPTEEWQQISNYELVQQADSIVIVKVKAEIPSKKRHGMSQVEAKVIKVIKGSYSEKKLLIRRGHLNYYGRTDENDFSDVRKGAKVGSCSPYDYKLDALFVLFLDKRGRVSRYIFSRINEEVDSIGSLWVKAVELYVETGKLNDYTKEKEALKKIVKTKGTPNALTKDIAKHFSMINKHKSTQDLMKVYRKTKDKSKKHEILWAFINKNDGSSDKVFEELLSSDAWLEYVTPVTRYLLEKKDENRVETLIDGYNKIAEKYTSSSNDILYTVGKLATKKDEKIILTFIESNPSKYVGFFSPWIIKNSSNRLIELVKIVSKKEKKSTYYKWILAKMGDKEIFNWAKEHMYKDFEDRWMTYYVIAMSPLDEADMLAQKLIENNTSKIDISTLVEGYAESTNKNRRRRLEEIRKKYPKDKELKYWIKKALRYAK